MLSKNRILTPQSNQKEQSRADNPIPKTQNTGGKSAVPFDNMKRNTLISLELEMIPSALHLANAENECQTISCAASFLPAAPHSFTLLESCPKDRKPSGDPQLFLEVQLCP